MTEHQSGTCSVEVSSWGFATALIGHAANLVPERADLRVEGLAAGSNVVRATVLDLDAK